MKKWLHPTNWDLSYWIKSKPDDEGNLFISPTSLWMAIAMVYNGADGATKEEIAKVLQVAVEEPMDVNKANASLMTVLNKDSETYRAAKSPIQYGLTKNIKFQEEFSRQTKII